MTTLKQEFDSYLKATWPGVTDGDEIEAIFHAFVAGFTTSLHSMGVAIQKDGGKEQMDVFMANIAEAVIERGNNGLSYQD